MKEQYKIDEAKFFLERMEGSIGDRIAFRYNLSAFLSAARSVLQYALTESAGKSNQKWYDDKVKQTNEALSNILEDFKEKRDANIHRGEPVDPARDVTVAISGGVMAIAAAGEVFFNDEPIEMSRPKEETPLPESTEGKPDITVRYRFNDWSGPEDIIVLSHRYIEVLENIVRDGIAKGILTG